MAEKGNIKGQSSLNASSDSSVKWDVPLVEEEKIGSEKNPLAAKAFQFIVEILKQLTFSPVLLNLQICHAAVIQFVVFWEDHKSDLTLKRLCSNFMARRGFPAWVQKYLGDVPDGSTDNLNDSTDMELISDLKRLLRALLVSMTDQGSAMCIGVCQSGLVSTLLLEMCSVTEFAIASNTVEYYESDDVDTIVTIIYNCSRHAECSTFLQDTDILSVLHPVRHTESKELKWMVLTTLCNVAKTNQDSKIIADTFSLRFVIDLLRENTWTNSPRPATEGATYSKAELVGSLESITAKAENRKLTVECGALEVLIPVLEFEEEVDVQVLVCGVLRNICRTESLRQDVKRTEVPELLQQLYASGGSEALRIAAKDILNTFQ